MTADVQFVDRTGRSRSRCGTTSASRASTSYEVDVIATNYFDREVQAIELVSRDFARGLVVTILEGF